MPPSPNDPVYVEEGVAADQEKIISLRPQVEEEVLKMIDFDKDQITTSLFWNLITEGKDRGKFWYKLEFYEKD